MSAPKANETVGSHEMTGDGNVERQHVAIVQATYAEVRRGNIPAVLELLTDDVEWTLQGPAMLPFARTRYGHAGVAEFFSQVGETIEFVRFEPRDFIAQGNIVVVLGYEHNRVRRTGRTFEQEWAHVYTIRDGKIATGRFFEDTAAYVEALQDA